MRPLRRARFILLATMAFLAVGLLAPPSAAAQGPPPGAGGSAGIKVTLVQGLVFPSMAAGLPAVVVVTAADANAAVLTASGKKNNAVTASVVEPSILMTTGTGAAPAEQIPVTGWTFGGSLVDGGGSGSGVMDGTGNITNMRVGATATVSASNVGGTYTGTATFRLVY